MNNLISTYKNKKVLITGNTGFKGSWLTVWFKILGSKVFGISNDIPTNPSMFESLCLDKYINHNEIDICNFESLSKKIKEIEPDFIFHMAAQPIVIESYNDPLNTFRTNAMGTANILESIRQLENNCTAIIITSDKCYDNIESIWGYKEDDYMGGKDVYSGSKGAAELIYKSYYHSFFFDSKNINISSARAGNVIGGGDWAPHRIVPDCIRAWKENKSVEIRSPEATRPWQHVLEPLSGYLALGMSLHDSGKLSGESFNFGPSADYNKTVYQLLNDLSKNWNLGFEPSFISKKTTHFHEAGLLKLNCDKALFHLKWLPTLNYNQIIDFTSQWYFNYYENNNDMLIETEKQIYKFAELAKEKSILWAN